MKKTRDLTIILGIYLLAFAVGIVSSFFVEGIMLKLFVFDLAATVVTFIFSVIYRNSSVYDAYWSFTPMLMAVWLFVVEKAFSLYQMLFLAVFLVWSLRLTMNWVEVFTDFSYEDWRYKKYRDETPRISWPIVNFFGIHLMPTLVVFAGMLPMFDLAKMRLNMWVFPGIIFMIMGVLLEYFADRQMHAFLENAKPGQVCDLGLWSYSRHPNYLGEITFWLGVYVTLLPFSTEHWYYGVGALSVAVLFNVVSIPLMEKRQMQRRPAYRAYKEKTPRLIIRPWKKKQFAVEE